jgi:hypothetical protein
MYHLGRMILPSSKIEALLRVGNLWNLWISKTKTGLQFEALLNLCALRDGAMGSWGHEKSIRFLSILGCDFGLDRWICLDHSRLNAIECD